jgi:hypothetical protein
MSNRAIGSIAGIFLTVLVTAALTQQFGQAASTACNAANRGTVNCPNYTAPAATAVPSRSMDGSMRVPATTSTTLFNGAVPPNAFIVQDTSGEGSCVVNDHGPANGNLATYAGFPLLNPQPLTLVSFFITPQGYKPMGPVSVWCGNATYVAAGLVIGLQINTAIWREGT